MRRYTDKSALASQTHQNVVDGPKMDPSKAVVYIRTGAPPKVTDTQSGSRYQQPMILVIGIYLGTGQYSARVSVPEFRGRAPAPDQ